MGKSKWQTKCLLRGIIFLEKKVMFFSIEDMLSINFPKVNGLRVLIFCFLVNCQLLKFTCICR